MKDIIEEKGQKTLGNFSNLCFYFIRRGAVKSNADGPEGYGASLNSVDIMYGQPFIKLFSKIYMHFNFR